ncbi:MAG: uroporphyrinogen-III synthase, partial [Candidatus Omnitrophica bacterium]|nr:uroporphyrinogen-III synthase [Candidatus Omnitrophota bacterium]
DVDMVTFTSSSCVEGFQKNFSRQKGVCAASLGPVTSATAKKYGLRVAVEAREYVLESLIEGIIKYYTKKKS